MSQRDERMALPAGTSLIRTIHSENVLLLLICCGVLMWVLIRPLPVKSDAPHGALWVLTAILLVTALLMRRVRMRFGLDARAALALPDPLYTLDLATAILAGPWAAAPVAVVASLLVTIPEGHAGQREWIAALRQAVVVGVGTAIAGAIYVWLWHPLSRPVRPAHIVYAQIAAAVAASLILLACAGLVRVLEHGSSVLARPFAWHAALDTPAFRFQALMLAIGPLLPLVDVLDNIEAELAWILFLIPLYATYYLALVSTRLEQRKAELQHTVAELGISRRREAELTGYAALVTRAQEEERRRLARELHDDTAQALVALARGLDTLSGQTSRHLSDVQDARFVEDLSDLAKRSLESIRRACQALRPSVLDDLGLSAALESLASATTLRGLPCEFSRRGEPAHAPVCPPEIETTIYRIAQESLTNAQRHAEATDAEIELVYLPAALRLCVRDNGQGFDYAATLSGVRHAARAPEARAGLGLLGMRERAALIGAHLEIASTPGMGTRVTLLVRLDDTAAFPV